MVDMGKLFSGFASLGGFAGCDETCEIEVMMRELESERTWIYIAYGYLPLDEKKQLSPEKIAILEAYFNQRRTSSSSRIKIVSHGGIKNIATCYAEIIRDMDMLSLTLVEE